MESEKRNKYIKYFCFSKSKPFDEDIFNRFSLVSDESKELVAKLRKISENGDFLCLTPLSLKTEEERRFVISAVDNGKLKNRSEVTFLTLLIDDARKKAKGKGNYLKNVKIPKIEENKSKDSTIDELFEKADAGDINAMLHVIYDIKINDVENEEAKNWLLERRVSYLRQIVKVPGHETSMVVLGDAYAYGEGVPQDAQKAIRWYKKAIKAYCTFAYENIGFLYFEGRGVAVDYKKAFNYFTKDKYCCSFRTFFSLGEMYRQGLYVEKDIDKACEYYQKIAFYYSYSNRFDPYYWRACYRLGMILYSNWKTEKTLNIAFELLTQAKDLYDKCNKSERIIEDIDKEELDRNWQIVKDTQLSQKNKSRLRLDKGKKFFGD